MDIDRGPATEGVPSSPAESERLIRESWFLSYTLGAIIV